MNQINPGGKKQRSTLRIVGPLVLATGGIFTLIGMVSFFSAFGGGGRPEYFWCAFVGMPIAAVGLMLCKFAFMGSVARYTAGELAPVGKDTFNYMAKGTKEGVRDVASAVTEGIVSGSGKGGGKSGNKESIEIRIRKLEKLRDQGLINAEDFEEQKDRILDEI